MFDKFLFWFFITPKTKAWLILAPQTRAFQEHLVWLNTRTKGNKVRLCSFHPSGKPGAYIANGFSFFIFSICIFHKYPISSKNEFEHRYHILRDLIFYNVKFVLVIYGNENNLSFKCSYCKVWNFHRWNNK